MSRSGSGPGKEARLNLDKPRLPGPPGGLSPHQDARPVLPTVGGGVCRNPPADRADQHPSADRADQQPPADPADQHPPADPADQQPAADDRPQEPDNLPTKFVVNLINSGLESALWRTAEVLSAQIAPVGPSVVRSVYLGRQLYTALRGLDSGDGFRFKLTIPGLDQLPGAPVPEGWELITRVRLGAATEPASEAGVWSEIQIFEPWVSDVDVAAADPAPTLGVPPAESVPPRDADPWAAWIALLGPELTRNVSEALSEALHRPISDVHKIVVQDF